MKVCAKRARHMGERCEKDINLIKSSLLGEALFVRMKQSVLRPNPWICTKAQILHHLIDHCVNHMSKLKSRENKQNPQFSQIIT